MPAGELVDVPLVAFELHRADVGDHQLVERGDVLAHVHVDREVEHLADRDVRAVGAHRQRVDVQRAQARRARRRRQQRGAARARAELGRGSLDAVEPAREEVRARRTGRATLRGGTAPLRPAACGAGTLRSCRR